MITYFSLNEHAVSLKTTMLFHEQITTRLDKMVDKNKKIGINHTFVIFVLEKTFF